MEFVHLSTRHRSRPTVPFILLCVVFFTMPSDLQAGNVLITTSLGEGSHYFVGKTIGKYLVKHGHNVTVLVSKAYAYRADDIEDLELNFIVFEQTAEQIASVKERHLAFSKNALEPNNVAYLLKMMKTARQGVADDCDELLGRNPDVMHQIESGNFDVVVYDMIWLCSLLLAMKINATAVLSSPMSLPVFTAYAHNPVNLAYVPYFMTGYTSSMSFLQRVNNVILNQGFSPMFEYMNQPFNELRERHKIRPDLTGSVSELVGIYTDLFLFNLDFAVEFPLPLLPNIIPIGGITARPVSPLPSDLEAFMQSSGDEGVILFTLGTYVSHIKSEFLEPFAEAFERYLQQKVLWQFAGEPRFKVPPNVKTMPWLPQNDILGHPKTHLFIFHGGNNGFYETIYHGVPAIIIPLTGDAIDQGVRLKHQGFGIVLDKTRVTVDSLDDAIKTILSNKSYSKMAKVLSSRLRSRSMHPGDRAAFWVNHVMKHGGDYMRSPLKDLNFIQRNLLDALGLFLVVISIILVIFYNCVRCSFRRCKRIFFSSKQKND
ncbi:UDP-glucuronosyltransferase 2C1-like [Lytechinus pictus]|uniref:UDP-glucuronosyltransferase 2C1-like n=1 Tax=Lytechinus pictus TaxID=7653 RepID=UPI0030B9E66C